MELKNNYYTKTKICKMLTGLFVVAGFFVEGKVVGGK